MRIPLFQTFVYDVTLDDVWMVSTSRFSSEMWLLKESLWQV